MGVATAEPMRMTQTTENASSAVMTFAESESAWQNRRHRERVRWRDDDLLNEQPVAQRPKPTDTQILEMEALLAAIKTAPSVINDIYPVLQQKLDALRKRDSV